MEPQALVRIFLPRLERRDAKSNCLYDKELELLYDHAVRPAAVATLPRELTAVWPATWLDEMFRATQNAENHREGRRVQHTGRDIHSAFLNGFVEHMRTLVNAKEELQWARSFFFIIEMRGLKTRDGSMHMPPDQPIAADDGDGELDAESPRVQAIERVLSSFHTAEFEEDCWFLDIGINFLLPSPLGGYACPLPAAEAHATILSHVLEQDMATCIRWANGYGGYYQRDELAQLKALAGFRFTNPNPEVNGICYVQLYTSDKSVIYNLNLPNHAKRITTWQILGDWDKARMHHFQPLIAAFREASGAHEMSVRLEVRVEFSQYPFVQLRVPDEQARTWMYWADPKDYWGWKLYRLESIYSVLRTWMDSRARFTTNKIPEVCTLLVTLVWMANALSNRPDEGRTWDEIRDSSSVHDMIDGELLPVWPLHAHFLHSLLYSRNEQPRMSGNRVVSNDTIRYVCSSKLPPISEDELTALISEVKEQERDLQPDALDEGPGHPHRVYPVAMANKQQVVRAKARERQPDQFADVLPEPEPIRGYDSEDEDYEERPRPTPLSQKLTDIISDLPIQIFQKCPQQKSGHSWCAFDRSSPMIRHNVFCSLETLDLLFPSHIRFGSETDKWTVTVDRLFPKFTPVPVTSDQGLHCLKARDDFRSLQGGVPREQRDELVRIARQYIHDHWVWLPYGAPKSHLWATGVKNVPKHAFHVGTLKGGPWIIMNPAFV
ncbi:hypothetical protein CTheo_8881 [Ceratobasidium theobromae]|uniref:Uncharacterized protein n=1 Tax=Ceratobasidium theobromae TaxID=1582974 RepID=A0A5N5Q8E5_9AGAM|nr:hypothetical protein CTheo_8881 [Ceratobasidium theobromae]